MYASTPHENRATAAAATPAERRHRLARQMAALGGGVALVPTAPARRRNADGDHPYRHDSHFHYLTGFGEPEAWLVLTAEGRSLLFCRQKDPEQETWEGRRLGPDAAPAVLGVDEAHPVSALAERMPQLLANQPQVWTLFQEHHELVGPHLWTWMSASCGRQRGWVAPRAHRDLSPLLSEMRLVKDDGELATMRRAGHISAGGHARAMRFCAQRFRDGATQVREHEIEAELLHEFRRQGAQALAYPSIVAAGENACVLHYEANDGTLRPGELCLIDAGCELDGYASDITRTFPATGRYTPAQRELYDIVLAAQQAAISATRPGARVRDGHEAAVRVLAQGMLDTGLLDRHAVGDVDAVVASAAYRRFYMHGTSHWLGRDVHDVGEYLALEEAPVDQPDGVGGRTLRPPPRRLAPGMVLTIEPGLYVRPADDVNPAYWNIGIRIEDDAVVTATGCELISRGVPVDADEIEALMPG